MKLPITGLSVEVPDDGPSTPGPMGPTGPAGPEGASGTDTDLRAQLERWYPIITAQGEQIAELQRQIAALPTETPQPQTVVEQGFWTPLLTGGDGATGQVYRYQQGSYIKIGRFVAFWGYTQFEHQGDIQGPLMLAGLPFLTATVPGFFSGGCAYLTNLSPAAANLTGFSIMTGSQSTAWTLWGSQIDPVTHGTLNQRRLTLEDVNLHTQATFHGSYYTD